MSLSFQGSSHFVANNKIRLEQKTEFWKTCIYHNELNTPQYIMTFLMMLVVTLMEVIFGYWVMNLEDIHGSVNQYFPNDQCILPKKIMHELKSVTESHIYLHVTNWGKFTDTNSMLQLTFKKVLLVDTGIASKNIHN